MALINCPECGNEVSDKALNCPKCGCPLGRNVGEVTQMTLNTNGISQNNKVPEYMTKKKAESKNRVKFFVIIAVLIIVLIFLSSGGNTDTRTNSTSVKTSPVNSSVEVSEESTPIENTKNTTSSEIKNDSKPEIHTIGIGESFSTGRVTYYVKDADLDYQLSSTEQYWIKKEDNDKCIKVKFSVTNDSSDEEYVSAGEFECYADNVKYTPELVSEGNYNDNIASGRTAEVEGVWVIPRDVKSIELEYNPMWENPERVIIKLQ